MNILVEKGLRLNAWTVTVQLEAGKTAYEKSYLNGKDNFTRNNQAIQGAIKFLEAMEPEILIGILVARVPMERRSVDKPFIGTGNIYNTYSHIQNDKENWVTVGEALSFLRSM